MLYQINPRYGNGEEQLSKSISTYNKVQPNIEKAEEDPISQVKGAVDIGKSAYQLKDLYKKWQEEGADGVENLWSRDNTANLPEVETPMESMGRGGPAGVDPVQPLSRVPNPAIEGDLAFGGQAPSISMEAPAVVETAMAGAEVAGAAGTTTMGVAGAAIPIADAAALSATAGTAAAGVTAAATTTAAGATAASLAPAVAAAGPAAPIVAGILGIGNFLFS